MIADEILPIILDDRKGKVYVEPFCGGCNSLCKVDGSRIGCDVNPYLISMWKMLTGFNVVRPVYISKALYDDVRASYNRSDGKYSQWYTGWVGFMASYNGRFFDGGYSGHDVNGRDYIAENIKNTLSQVPLLKGVEFYARPYDEVTYQDCVIYCDPPYQGTKQYSVSRNFDYPRFWSWVRRMSRYNQVFVSEYSAPDDFECVWKKQVTNSLNSKITKRPVERLFKYKSL